MRYRHSCASVRTKYSCAVLPHAHIDIVDIYTRYSWQRAIETNAQGKFTQEASVKAVIDIIDAIKSRFGADAIQPGTQLKLDNGPEFKRGTPVEDDEERDVNEDTGYFKRMVEQHEPNIRVTYSVANNPNTNALTERQHRNWRAAARRMLFNQDPRLAKNKLKKDDEWFRKWFGTIASEGRYGEQLADINSIINDTPNRTLNNHTPTEFLTALMADPRSDDEKEIVDTINKHMVDSQEKRRKESTARPFAKGDWVRLLRAPYAKATLRGNYDKFMPRYSTEVYRIRRVTGGDDGAPNQYQIESFDMDDPSAETTSKKSFYRSMYGFGCLFSCVENERIPIAGPRHGFVADQRVEIVHRIVAIQDLATLTIFNPQFALAEIAQRDHRTGTGVGPVSMCRTVCISEHNET